MRRKILHVIAGLNSGGAEMTLYRLLPRLQADSVVVSLTGIGAVGRKIQDLGVSVCSLDAARGRPDPRMLLRLARVIRRYEPDLIQTWMYHADLVGGLAAKMARRTPVVWNVRHSTLDPAGTKRTTLWTARACAAVSSLLPYSIVCCSRSALQEHVKLGYDSGKMVMIPNGVDSSAFRPDPEARRSMRRSLDLDMDADVIGIVARFDPQKDHQTFFRAAAQLRADRPKVRFLLCGDGITWENEVIAEWIHELGLADNVRLLGHRDDVPRFIASLDLLSLSSYTEAFPNVIAEAMACGIPCVTTDVGDARVIVGSCGVVVSPRDPSSLAAGWSALLNLPEGERNALKVRAQERIQANFSLHRTVAAYEELYDKVLGAG